MFPSTMPLSSIQMVVDYLRGVEPPASAAHLAHAAWEIVGYALGVTVGQPAVASSCAAPATDIELADALEAHSAMRGPDAGAIPWNLLVPILLKLLERWL